MSLADRVKIATVRDLVRLAPLCVVYVAIAAIAVGKPVGRTIEASLLAGLAALLMLALSSAVFRERSLIVMNVIILPLLIPTLILDKIPPTGWIVNIKWTAATTLLVLGLTPLVRRFLPILQDDRPTGPEQLWDAELDR